MEGEMLKGHLDMIVLAALAVGPAHGYAVIEEIRSKSGQAFDLPEGTIYPALHRLEQAGLLSSHWVVSESRRQRRVYELTRRGQRALKVAAATTTAMPAFVSLRRVAKAQYPRRLTARGTRAGGLPEKARCASWASSLWVIFWNSGRRPCRAASSELIA
jgi:PadR family transcriptional regulator, regulatory protein PadR